MRRMERAPLTHLDAAGRARMVDVSAKAPTDRYARARAVVRMSPEAAARVAAGDAPKGDVAGVARLAAIQAAKRTDELIPLAHSLPLTHVDPDVAVDAHGRPIGDVRISVTDRCNFRCQYCMPAEGLPWLDRSALLTYEEIERLVRALGAVGRP